jgi:heme exporter protein B
MSMLRQVGAIVAKDLVAELHTREILSAMFVFAIMAMLIFSFALDLRGAAGRAAAPGVLWTTIAFSGTLGLSRTLAREQENGCLSGLLLAVEERSVVFFGKAVGSFVLMLAVEVVLLPLGSVLLDVNLLRLDVFVVLLLGTIGYAAVGTLLAAIAVNTRAREVMLPILALPVLVPLLIAAVQATAGLLGGADSVGSWLRILVIYDLLITAVGVATFEFVVEG